VLQRGATNNKNVSFHIIISNLHFVSSQQCLEFVYLVTSATNLDDFIDIRVYKSLKCFRLHTKTMLYITNDIDYNSFDKQKVAIEYDYTVDIELSLNGQYFYHWSIKFYTHVL